MLSAGSAAMDANYPRLGPAAGKNAAIEAFIEYSAFKADVTYSTFKTHVARAAFLAAGG